MRQFKFIRGKYTDENIFNSDETTACLFAYDKNGELVELTVKNDKDFQDKFAKLSSDRLSEIYTLRPSQFTISAKQQSDDSYDFTYTPDEITFDKSRDIPIAVRNAAAAKLKAASVAFDTSNGKPNLIFSDSALTKTKAVFNLEGKTFERNLKFVITGKLKERGYATAQGENIDAYPTDGDKIDFGGEGDVGTKIVNGTFYQGRLQTAAPTETGSIIHNTKTINTSGDLDLAKNYLAKSGFSFIKDGKFTTNIPYNDDLSFTLYEKVTSYLTTATAAKAAVTNKQFSSNESKYKSIGDGKYELYSSASAYDENVQYFLIKQGGTSSPKLRKLSGTTVDTYSVITEEDGYYLVDNNTPKHTTDLGFYQKNINEILSSGPSGGSKTIGDARIAFVKNGDSWEKLPASAVITQKYYATLDNGNTKTYIDSITINAAGDKYTVNGNIQFPSSCGINADLLYNNIVLTTRNFCMFDASNPGQYINSAYLDTAVVSGATGLDWNGYFYTLEEAAITTTYSLKTGYVAYEKNETLTSLIDGNKNTVYERNTNEKTTIDSLEYNFYHLNTGTAYMYKGDCTVPAGLRRATEFVEGYAASYERYYVFKDNQLSNISAEDLLNKSTIDYYENNNHHIVGNGVYDDDSTDTTRYVALSDDKWVTGLPINKDNTLVNENNVISPNTTNNVLRFITEVEVNATQTD